MANVTITMSVERESHAWDSDVIDAMCEYDVTITADVTPIRRGRFSGPPERCFPDEGGQVDIISATTEDDDEFELTDSEIENAKSLLLEKYLDQDDDCEERCYL